MNYSPSDSPFLYAYLDRVAHADAPFLYLSARTIRGETLAQFICV
jgi:hypothetical protein